jgi:hypothetical protein
MPLRQGSRRGLLIMAVALLNIHLRIAIVWWRD